VNLIEIIAIAIVVVSALLILGLALLQREFPSAFREIPAFARLRKAIGLAVEDGTRIHFSVGRGGLILPWSASALASFAMLRRISELTSASDHPPIVTSGEGTLAILSQDTLKSAYSAASMEERYDPSTGRLTGMTPFSYAAGVLPIMRDENVSANVLVGSFGIEVALLADTAERENSFTLLASDNLPAQAVLYATGPDPLIGEELYAVGAYAQAGPLHNSSLRVQDILRWGIIIGLIIGVFVKLLAGIL
jgi:hypothetical protein